MARLSDGAVAGTTKKAGRKHVLIACLECRRRHYKCDGTMPVCQQCSKRGAECVFVESHRGGSRKKGVRKSQRSDANRSSGVSDIEDMVTTPKTKREIEKDQENLITQIYRLPCASDKEKCLLLDCPGKDIVHGKMPLNGESAEQVRKRIKLGNSVHQLDCMISNKHSGPEDATKIKNMDFEILYSNPRHLIDVTALNQQETIKKYYLYFHPQHPVLGPPETIGAYISNAPELLMILKVIGDGQLTSIYAKDVTLVQDRLLQICNMVKATPAKDVVSLQVLILALIAAHISLLHQLGRKLRECAIFIIEELGVHELDHPTHQARARSKVCLLPRVQHLPKAGVVDCGRRALWEVYFLDVIIGSADGKSLTKLAQLEINANYPSYPDRDVFDFRSRSEAAKLVTEAINLNLEIIAKKPFQATLARLKAELLNWEMRMADPLTFNCPGLLLKNGSVNEGVHQLILLVNYAKIFVHRPFSYLWKIEAPQNPPCGDDVMEASDMPTQLVADARTTIETRKAIEAANLMVGSLIDTNAALVLSRTPLFACALALAALVHISAYIWIETILDLEDPELVKLLGLQVDELEVYAEYIKLLLTAIYPISRHWILSGKISKHIRDSLQALRPRLYSKLKDLLPQLEVAIEQLLVDEAKVFTPPILAPMPPSLVSLSSQHSSQASPLTANHLSPHSSITPTASATPPFGDFSKPPMPVHDPTLLMGSNQPAHAEPDLFLLDSATDNLFDFNQWDWEPSPAANSGCDWIDKALLDYFEGDKQVDMVG